ncbi:MAG TPA: hypothetical protein VGW31_05320 [Hanamia sp.]|nr:hypothetical protein [Hanamia sp.]
MAKEELNLLQTIFMEIINIRQKLHQLIDMIEDKKAEAIYTLFEDEMNTDAKRRNLIQLEREKYLNEEGKSYSWDEVKQMATDKKKRRAI